MTLRPLRNRPGLAKERGVWVYRTGEPLRASTAEEALKAVRGMRAQRALGRIVTRWSQPGAKEH